MVRDFKKHMLRNGDVVEGRTGWRGIVMTGTPMGSFIKWFQNQNEEVIHKYHMLDAINPDMSFTDGTGKIVKVYRPTDRHDFTTMNAVKPEYLIWKDVTKKMTVAEIEEALGYKVEVVAE